MLDEEVPENAVICTAKWTTRLSARSKTQTSLATTRNRTITVSSNT
jgi:hypothetical protein